MTPAEATLWLIASPFIIIGGGAILAIVIRAFSPEAQVQLYAPVKAWAGAHPLAFRTLLVLGGWALAKIAGGVLSLVATLALAVWLFVLVIRYWQTPWVLPAWRFVKASALDVWDWAWARFHGIPEQERRIAARRAADFAIEAKSVRVAIATDSPEGDGQISVQLTAWDAEIERLLKLSRRRTQAENDQLAQMSRDRQAMQAQLLGAGAIASAPMAAFGPVQRRSFLPALAAGSPIMWGVAAIAGVFAWGAWERSGKIEAQSEAVELGARLDAATRALVEARATNEQLADVVTDATVQTRQTAETIEAERARRARTERELRRIRDAENAARASGTIDYGFGSVRDDAGSATGASGDSGPAAGDPSSVLN